MPKNRFLTIHRAIVALTILVALSLVFRFAGYGSSDEPEFRPPIEWVVDRPDPAAEAPAWTPPARPAPDPENESDPVDDGPQIDPCEKMSGVLAEAVANADPDDRFRVIVQPRRTSLDPTADIRAIREYSRTEGLNAICNLDFIGASVYDLSRDELLAMSSREEVGRVSYDLQVQSTGRVCDVSTQVLGADQVWEGTDKVPGYTGAGVTVAVIDSGVDRGHIDFKKRWKSRVTEQTFVKRYGDDFGHGTHVAGIIGGSGRHLSRFVEQDRNPAIGVAPESKILSLRVLNEDGVGYASDVIAAIAYATLFKDWYGVRVINMSLGGPVTQSYQLDPLALACRLAVEMGIVVVCSAGNSGSSDGEKVFGSISTPGNSPWVITVGATNSQCTTRRPDDTIAKFSSRGPTAIDGLLKPDLVAPGVGIVAAQPMGPDFINDNYPVQYELRDGTDDHYMVLNGTSMSAPMVSGTLALMFEANPGITPNMAKAVLMYTAEKMTDPSILEQGSGLLNAEAAVRMALALREGQKLLDVGQFQLDADGPQQARGMLEPVTYIGNEKVYWGASFIYGRSVVWGLGSILADNILWGNGRIWSDTILWTHGEPWYDELMATKTPVFGNTILWTHGGLGGLVWSDTILWTYSDIPGFDPNNYVVSETILWSYSDVHSQWSGSMVDPASVEAEGHGVLVEGEDYHASGAEFIDEGSPYYPRE